MVLWMYNDGKAPSIDTTSSTPKDICEGNPTRSCNSYSSEYTGYQENDKLANVYDLLGCTQEWGMEASGTDERGYHGGGYNDKASLGYCGSYRPYDQYYDWRNESHTLYVSSYYSNVVLLDCTSF